MITKILNKYDGFRNYWFPELGEEESLYTCDEKIKEKYTKGIPEKEKYLLQKYKKYIPKGWYGFSFGTPLNIDWLNIIEEFIDYLIDLQNKNKINNFEIHQIKLKIGGVRVYISFSCEDEEFREYIELQINKLEEVLFDKKLIY